MKTPAVIDANLPFSKLLPELFPLVAGHLPLHATPTTLLSLALINHDVYNIVYPLLCSCLILRNEKDALDVLSRILVDEQLGHAVRELHIMSGLSLATRNGERPFDVVTGLEKVILAGLLPHIHTLSLHLHQSWFWDDVNMSYILGYGQLRARFWKGLRRQCPRLRGVIVRGIGDKRDSWLDESGIYELNELRELSHLGLVFAGSRQAHNNGVIRLMKNIRHVSSSLQSFVLGANFDSCLPMLSLDFPLLKSLVLIRLLCPVGHISEAMTFWKRHPSLERLKFLHVRNMSLWFDETIQPGILPNLRHLEANFKNVYALAPILPQLVSLSIESSINAQILYLLRRSVIPNGLPNLKGLEIDQYPYSGRYIHEFEGGMWYETPDGEGSFYQDRKLDDVQRPIDDHYLRSIASQAPNLEEFAMHLSEPVTANLYPGLTEFRFLERLYLKGLQETASDHYIDGHSEANRATFLSGARLLAEGCISLKMITDVNPATLPYPVAKIRRSRDGMVEDVIVGEGYGRQIGYEDDPFPLGIKPQY